MSRHALLSLSLSCLLMASASANDVNKTAHPGVAVVELFTSEGCSSCPPADKLLSELASTAKEHQLPIVCIGWHVDYWNRLGWDDRFSSKTVSDRQRRYAAAFDSNRIYTPQMIVNGTNEFTGSNRGEAAEQITAAIEKPTDATLNVQILSRQDSTVRVHYKTAHAPRGDKLVIVLVENAAKTDVGRGENSGRMLSHVNAARQFEIVAIPASGSGDAELTMPADLNAGNASLIAFLQDAKTMQIHGATKLAISK